MKNKIIKVRGGRNIRSITDYENSFNRKIKKDILIRSARLDKMSNKIRNLFLKKYNIKTVVDFRTEVEANEGNKVIFPADIMYYHIPLINQSVFGITHEKNMRKALFKESKKIKDDSYYYDFMINMYKSIIFDPYSQEQLKLFFNVLLEHKEGAILFHCTGGKDRTGIAALLILTILGVSYNDILLDYSMSDIQNKRHNNTLTFLIKAFLPYKRFKRLLIEMLHAKREYLEETINAINLKYGSIMKFLEDIIMLDEDKFNIIRNKFFE